MFVAQHMCLVYRRRTHACLCVLVAAPGLLPYFFRVLKNPARSLELNRCVYNSMYDTDACRNVTLPHVKSAHFTVCQKPWTCHLHHVNLACNTALDKWHELRKEVGKARGRGL